MGLKRAVQITLLALTMVFSNGCWVALAGAGAGVGTAWYYGALRSTEAAEHQRLFEAAKSALQDMNISIESANVDDTAGKIEARTADNKQVSISVKHLTDSTSELIIRVGLTDEAGARAIYEKIQSRMGGL